MASYALLPKNPRSKIPITTTTKSVATIVKKVFMLIVFTLI